VEPIGRVAVEQPDPRTVHRVIRVKAMIRFNGPDPRCLGAEKQEENRFTERRSAVRFLEQVTYP